MISFFIQGNNIMKIITINQFYFNKNFGDILKSNNNEIQDNKLGRRPYF